MSHSKDWSDDYELKPTPHQLVVWKKDCRKSHLGYLQVWHDDPTPVHQDYTDVVVEELKRRGSWPPESWRD